MQLAESGFVAYVYTVSGLTSLYWTTNKEPHPWERSILLLPAAMSCV